MVSSVFKHGDYVEWVANAPQPARTKIYRVSGILPSGSIYWVTDSMDHPWAANGEDLRLHRCTDPYCGFCNPGGEIPVPAAE